MRHISVIVKSASKKDDFILINGEITDANLIRYEVDRLTV